MTDVFISYSRKDKDFVLALHQALVKHERDTWVEPTHNVDFSPDGEYLAIASADKTARVQPWRPEGLTDEACARLTRNLTKEEWQQNLSGTLFYRKTCPNLPEPRE